MNRTEFQHDGVWICGGGGTKAYTLFERTERGAVRASRWERRGWMKIPFLVAEVLMNRSQVIHSGLIDAVRGDLKAKAAA